MGAKIEIHGNLGAKPEIKQTNDGKPFIQFSVYQAHWIPSKDQNGRDTFEDKGGMWLDCVWFNNGATEAMKHLDKGSPVVIIGDLRMDSWMDMNTKQERRKLKVVVKTLGLAFKGAKQNATGNDNQDMVSSGSELSDSYEGDESLPF